MIQFIRIGSEKKVLSPAWSLKVCRVSCHRKEYPMGFQKNQFALTSSLFISLTHSVFGLFSLNTHISPTFAM